MQEPFYPLDSPIIQGVVCHLIAKLIIPVAPAPGVPPLPPAAIAARLLARYRARTRRHIRLVNLAARFLAPAVARFGLSPAAFLAQCRRHDWDKLSRPKLAAYYAVVCPYRYGAADGTIPAIARQYRPTEKAERKYDEIYWPSHMRVNPHHIYNRVGIPDADGCRMVPEADYGLALPEMACDWTAIALEQSEPPARDGYYAANVGKCFRFRGATKRELEAYLDYLAARHAEMVAEAADGGELPE